MRGNDDDTDRPRPIFSRSADGRLRAGNGRVAPTVFTPDEPEERPRKEAPVLVIPSKAQPAVQSSSRPVMPMMHQESSGQVQSAQRAPEGPTDGIDVGDIWSEQERIRLQENWEEEQRKKERRQRRKELLRKKITGIPAQPPGTPPAQTITVTPAATVTPPVHTEPKEVVLNISMPSMPKITLPKFQIPAVPRISRQRALLFGGIAGMAIVGVIGFTAYRHYTANKANALGADKNGVKVTTIAASKANGKPEYATVLPAGKTIADFGGWVRISPADKNPVYAYADKIDNVLVNVSEQPVPDSFQKDVDTAMDDLAASYSANDKIKVGTVTAYIGTSIKGPQSVLMIKGDLLILIKSAAKVADNHWETYIRSLQ